MSIGHDLTGDALAPCLDDKALHIIVLMPIEGMKSSVNKYESSAHMEVPAWKRGNAFANLVEPGNRREATWLAPPDRLRAMKTDGRSRACSGPLRRLERHYSRRGVSHLPRHRRTPETQSACR